MKAILCVAAWLLLAGTLPFQAGAEPVHMGLSLSIAPYVIPENHSGVEMEIIRAALNVRDHGLVPKYLPLARSFMEFDQGKLDGVINVKPGMVESGYYSDEVIVFENMAVSLARNEFAIETIADLKDKDVVAFQRAGAILGEAFDQMARANPHYREVANQIVQINLLFTGRTDAVVMDRNIFRYFRKQAQIQDLPGVDVRQKVRYHRLFPRTHYRCAFKRRDICRDFDFG